MMNRTKHLCGRAACIAALAALPWTQLACVAAAEERRLEQTGAAASLVIEPLTSLAISAGGDSTCATQDGLLKCWGYNTHGQLGLGNTAHRGDDPGEMGVNLPVIDLGTGRTALMVRAGYTHTCALLDGGEVKCWGRNNHGQLGLGDTTSRGDSAGEVGDALLAVNLGTGRTATAIAAGNGNHTCALLDSGQVKCWGRNDYGQLGLGDKNARGDSAGELGDALPAVNLGTGRTAAAIATASSHTCALLDNGQVKCWGYGSAGQLGLGSTTHRGDNAGEMGDSLPAVSLGTGRTATAIAVGHRHTCALLDNGQVKCWGGSYEGQLGLGISDRRGHAPGQMGDSLPAVNLGTGRTATAIIAGAYSTCALLDNSQVKCWGDNSIGQLGLGDNINRGDNPGEMGDTLPAVNLGMGRTGAAIAAGVHHTCALLDDDQVKCWGYNTQGQLGLGDWFPRGDGAGEMGDNLLPVDIGF